MKKILGLTVAALLVMGLVGGGTWAYFSDPETSSGNTFTTGTMDITVNDGDWDGSAVITTLTNLKPSDSGDYTFMIENVGSIAGKLSTALTLSYDEGTETEPELDVMANDATGGDLDKYLGVRLTQKIGDAAATNIVGDGTNYAPLEDLKAAWEALSAIDIAAAVAPDDSGADTIVYTLYWKIADDIKSEGTDGLLGTTEATEIDDNVIQGDVVTMAFTFTITQVP